MLGRKWSITLVAFSAVVLFFGGVSGQVVDISGPDALNWCEQATYTITFDNDSVQTASSVIITNTLADDGFFYVAGSARLILHDGVVLAGDPDEVGLDLLWDADTLLGMPYELPPGEELTLEFDLRTNCDAQSGMNSVRVAFDLAGVPDEATDSLAIDVLPGAVAIDKEPGLTEACLGDLVMWTITVENTGVGSVYNVVVADVLGSGFSYDSSNPAGAVDGQTIVWEIPEILPGGQVELLLWAEVVDSTGLDNQADVRFGCDDGSVCFDTAIDGGTATAEVLHVVEEPFLELLGPDQMGRCEQELFTVVFTASDTNTANSIVITSTRPEGFTYVPGSGEVTLHDGTTLNADPDEIGLDLVWDLDALTGDDYVVPSGGEVRVEYELETSCGTLSGNNEVRVDYVSCTIAGVLDDTLSIEILPGAVVVYKEPGVIEARVGDVVEWTITVENTGFGPIYNVVVTDVLGSGLAYDSSDPVGTVDGQTVVWEIPQVLPDETVEVVLWAEVIACSGLDNRANVRFGCDDGPVCFDTAIDGGTATASILLILENPLLEWDPPNIEMPYCSPEGVLASMPITNTGPGPARNVRLCVDCDPLVISDVVEGAEYVDGCFVLDEPLLSEETFDLEFTVSVPEGWDWCAGVPSGTVLCEPIYENVCGTEFRPPVQFGSFSTTYGPEGPPTLNVSLSGAQAVYICTEVDYDLSVWFGGLDSCGNGATSDIAVEVAVPGGFTVVETGGGTWIPAGDGTGGTISWTVPPTDPLSTKLTLTAPGTDQCGQVATLTATAAADDCCGCEISSTSSVPIAIECFQLVTVAREASPSTQEKCGEITYTNTYTFADPEEGLPEIRFTDLTFDAYAENAQEYVDDSLKITIDDSSVPPLNVINNTPGCCLTIEGIDDSSLVWGSTLVISYTLELTKDSLPAACPSSHTFFTWTTLDLGEACTTGDACTEPCQVTKTLLVTSTTPSMSVSVDGLPSDFVHPCGTYDVTVTLTKTSAYDPHEVFLTLENLNYYIVDLGTIGVSGVEPEDVEPVDYGTYYEWTYGDAFVGEPFGTWSILTFQVQKRCGPGLALRADAYFKDACGGECSRTATDTPSLLLEPTLSVVKTPEIVYATRNEVSWTIYVTNSGAGHAYEVWVDDILGAGLEYVSSTVTPAAGVVTTEGQDHDGNPINGVSWYIPDIPAGATRTIVLNARLVGCQDLGNEVWVGYACGDEECMIPVWDTSDVVIPPTSLTATSVTATPIAMCAVQPATIRIRNSGDPAVYNIVARQILPEGIAYVPGTTEWRVVNVIDWVSGGEPSISNGELTWTQDEIDGLEELRSRRTLEIRFDIQALCEFDGGVLKVEVDYETVCGDPRSLPVGTFNLGVRTPSLAVTKSQIDPPGGGPIDCGGEMTWRIDVTNTGDATAQYIWVEDTLGDGFAYVSSEGDEDYSVDDGCNVGQVVTWALERLPVNTTASLFLTAREIECGALTNEVEAWWGCGESLDSCIDDSLCLTDTEVSDETEGARGDPSVSLSAAFSPSAIEACSTSTYTLTIQNTSTFTASAIDARVVLAGGLAYVLDSTQIDCGSGFEPAPDPAVYVNELRWYDENDPLNNLCAEIPPGGTVRLRFDVQAACYLERTWQSARVWFYDCCETEQQHVNVSVRPTAQLPVLTITKTPDTVALDCHDETDTVTWTITVTNTGDATADWVRIEDTLGAHLVYDGSSPEAVFVGDQTWAWELGPLAPGGSHTVEITAYLAPPPNDCSVAPRTNTARATWGCGDPDTGDTCASGVWVEDTARVTVPDLTLSPSDIDPRVVCIEDGDYVGRVRLVIRNPGDGNVTRDFRLRVEESATGWAVEGYFQADFGGTLPIVASRTIWIEDVPLTCAECDYTFTVTLDLDDDICECNEANNTNTRVWTMTLPDLRVADEDLTLSCASDGEVRISGTVTLANDGCGDALTADVPMRFALYDRQGCGGEEIHQWTQVFTGVNLVSGGGTQEFAITAETIAVNLCEEAMACGVSLFIEADYEDAICECSDTHNNLCVDFAVDIPSLTIDEEALELSCVDDGEVAISGSVTLRNDGCGSPLTTDVPMRFTLFGGPGCGGEILDEWTETFTGVDLVAGGGTQVFTITTRTSAQDLCAIGCEVWLLIEADYDGSICECDGTNNTRCVTLPVGIPDLVVTAVVPDVPDSCSTGTVDVTVRNIGCVGVELGILVRITGDATGQSPLPALAPDAETTVTISLNEVLPCGSYSITATVDPDDELCECSSVDNAMEAEFDVVDPDLAVLNMLASCSVDGTFDVSAEIHNLGTQDAPPSVVRIYVNEELAHQEVLPGLAIDTQQLIAFTSASLPCGEVHSFRVVVDEDDEICECNETNNEATVTASCPCPALVTDKRVDQILRAGVPISTDGPIEPGDVITYLLEVTNVGDGWAYNVNLTDELPEEFLYVVASTEAAWPLGSSVDDPAGVPGPNLAWALGATLRGGETLTLTFDASVTSDIRQGLSYTNTMWATGEEGDGTPIPPDSSDRVPEDDDPDDSSDVTLPTVVPGLRVDKAITDVLRAGASIWPVSAVEPGDVIEYRFEIENIGTGTAYNVNFTDELPFGVEYDTTLGDGVYEVDAPAAAGSLGIADGETGLITADIGATIAGGGTLTAVYRVRVTSDVSQGVPLINEAVTTGEDGAGNPIPEFNDDVGDTYPDEDSTEIGVREPGLALRKAITDVLRNGASIWPTPIVLWGDVLVYEVVIRNVGLGTAYNVDFTDELPFGVAYDTTYGDGTYEVDDPSASGALGIPDGAEGLIAAGLSVQINSGGTLTAVYRVRVMPEAIPGSYLTNLAVVTGEDGAGTPIPEFNEDVGDVFPDEDSTTIRLGAPALVTGKDIYCDPCDPDQPCDPCEPEPRALEVGMRVPFELTVTNVGYSAAYDVDIEDLLPPGFAYIEASTRIVWPGGILEGEVAEPLGAPGPELWWPTNATLEAGETLVLVFEALVTEEAPVGETIVNTMWARAVDDFGVPIPPDSSAIVPEDDDPYDSAELKLFVLPPSGSAGETRHAPDDEKERGYARSILLAMAWQEVQ